MTALGDPTRQAIVEQLARGPRAVGELARDLPVGRPAVSQHLKVLKEAGLVIDQPVGTRRLYRLNPDGIGALRAQLDRFWINSLAAFKRAVEPPNQGGHMTQQATDTAVRHAITVDAPIDRAFAVFTEQAYVNPDHHLRDVDMERTVLEPRVGGRWYERSVDGGECDWGRVLVYEPPHRIVLTWQITPDFAPEPDPAKASEVDVRFVAEDEQRTRVELEHRALERHGEGWEKMRAAVDSPGGWPGELQRFAAVATG